MAPAMEAALARLFMAAWRRPSEREPKAGERGGAGRLLKAAATAKGDTSEHR